MSTEVAYIRGVADRSFQRGYVQVLVVSAWGYPELDSVP